ncbi:MAG: hypothetical protein IJC11_02995 [Alphaproteobacteria bacterium]|nr:hypothetical protein [Alphaproteobacteria bacterium]MBQ6854033.1 hypothetical protein [Alphaproteobacteria bacterium]
MKNIIRILIFCLGCFCVKTVCATEKFLPETEDIPLMDGLIVQSPADLNFDTPEGQIIIVETISTNLTKEQVYCYYAKTLPEIGWKQITDKQYIREKDTILIKTIQEKQPLKIHFEITVMNNL